MMPITFAFDHLVYAVPDLDASTRLLEERLGVRVTPGGSHPGRGSKNALVGMGPRSYLEIIGPDPAQPAPNWFGLADLQEPRVVTWAVGDAALEERVAAAGGLLGPIAAGSRTRPDGQTLRWRFTDPARLAMDGVVPFFIDWVSDAHPAGALVAAVSLLELRLEHPQADEANRVLRKLGVAAEVHPGAFARITVRLSTPRGEVTL
ncbi:MAG TPA: VOC family protein [Myxococcales bacterium]|jgi:catechol 2,3-dioxygenase-like lactoylglutathione lyase family enzyme